MFSPSIAVVVADGDTASALVMTSRHVSSSSLLLFSPSLLSLSSLLPFSPSLLSFSSLLLFSPSLLSFSSSSPLYAFSSSVSPSILDIVFAFSDSCQLGSLSSPIIWTCPACRSVIPTNILLRCFFVPIFPQLNHPPSLVSVHHTHFPKNSYV